MTKGSESQLVTALVILVPFLASLLLACGAGISSAMLTVGKAPLGEFRAIAVIVSALIFIFLFSLLICRLMLATVFWRAGDVTAGSRVEAIYRIYGLFDLMVFTPVLTCRLFPIPFLGLAYAALGARLSPSAAILGIICDPFLVRIDGHALLGWDCLILPHGDVVGGLSLYPIHIGKRATIGARAIIMAGVTVGDDAIVAAGAVVTQGSQIGPGEIWGGVPAKFIRKRELAN